MKSHTVYRTFRTEQRREFVRITEDVEEAVREAGIAEGMALVSAMHITAGVWINDDEPGIQGDALEWLDKVAPPSWQEPANEVARELLPDPGDYRHHRGGEDNGDAHLKNLLVHHQVIVPVTNGQLDLGPWQQIFYCEFDGRPIQAPLDKGDGGVSSVVFAADALAGRVALVTGGGTNLGKAAAAELARCGANVVIVGRREEVLAEAASEIGPRCSPVAGDIRSREGAEAIVRACLERHGKLHFVLNNAGGQYFVPAEAIATKGWRAVQRLNVEGTLAMCHAAYELAMQPAGRGTIVNVTVSPHHGMPAMAHTGVARAAVEALTRELAENWAPNGVTVSAIALGRFATESLRKYPAELWRRAGQSVPLQRLGTLEEYGWLVALLASELGRSFAGSVVTLDGALDNWPGVWPPPDLTRDGEVPIEERRPVPGG